MYAKLSHLVLIQNFIVNYILPSIFVPCKQYMPESTVDKRASENCITSKVQSPKSLS